MPKARSQLDKQMDGLTVLDAWHPHRGGGKHVRSAVDHVLDGFGKQVFPTADEHLVCAPIQIQPPVLAKVGEVSGIDPLACIRLALHQFTTHTESADLSRTDRCTVGGLQID